MGRVDATATATSTTKGKGDETNADGSVPKSQVDCHIIIQSSNNDGRNELGPLIEYLRYMVQSNSIYLS